MKFLNKLRGHNDPHRIAARADSLVWEGNRLLKKGRTQQAITRYTTARQLYVQLQDDFQEASLTGTLGKAYGMIGQREVAQQLFEEALTKGKQVNNNQIIVAALGNLGLLAQYGNQLDQAYMYFQEALMYARTVPDTEGVRYTLNNIAHVCSEQGKYQEAIDYYSQFLQENSKTDNRRDDAVCMSSMAIVYTYLGEMQKARELLQKALHLLERCTNPEAPLDIVKVNALMNQLENDR